MKASYFFMLGALVLIAPTLPSQLALTLGVGYLAGAVWAFIQENR